MHKGWRTLGGWWLAWALLSAAAGAWLAHGALAERQARFDTEARIAHRLLSQQMVQHDAILSTLALLDTGDERAPAAHAPQRLSAVYPSVLRVQRRARGQAWADAGLAAAEAQSAAQRGPVPAGLDLARGRYTLALSAGPVGYALDIDLPRVVPWAEWPADPRQSPHAMALEHAGQRFVLQSGRDAQAPGGWHYGFRKALASPSQPFTLAARLRVGWAELPWGRIAGASALAGVLLAGTRLLIRQRTERRRAEELLRLGQIGRLNALGELAAGMAHELNQPLTAVLANTQAAARLLDAQPPDTAIARQAMAQAADQARRAAAVVGRLRRTLERPDTAATAREQRVDLHELARQALHLMAPECERHQVTAQLQPAAAPVRVQADPVAVEQIVHNLLLNAVQALRQVPAVERRLRLAVQAQGPMGELRVGDSGPGIAAEALDRLFEPFFTTRSEGLGLGLSLSETLAAGMGGSLTAANTPPRGACFTLRLPLA